MTEAFAEAGVYGAYFKYAEDKAGESGGKKYEEIRSYGTLVVTQEK